MSPSSVSPFSPRLRTVSIIPGMLNFAPERTDTSSGFAGSPNRLPACSSTVCMRPRTSSISPSGTVRPLFIYCTQALVMIVNPGGTGRPTRLISERPAPFPPSSSRIDALPSSKSIVQVNSVRGIPEVFAMIIPRSPLRFGAGPDGPLSCQETKVGHLEEGVSNGQQQRQAIGPHGGVGGHQQDLFEERIDGIGKPFEHPQGVGIPAVVRRFGDGCADLPPRLVECQLDGFLQHVLADLRRS